MDAFSKALQADTRTIITAPVIYQMHDFGQLAEQFNLGERDVVLTNEFIYKPFMEKFNIPCQ